MSKINGFVTLPAGVVSLACKMWIKAEDARMEQLHEEQIASAIAHGVMRFNWKRLRSERHDITREEAVELLGVSTGHYFAFSPWDLCERARKTNTMDELVELYLAAKAIAPEAEMLIATHSAAKIHEHIKEMTK